MDSNLKLQSCVLETSSFPEYQTSSFPGYQTSSFPGSHTAERIKEHALNASENFGITGRVAAFVHDEAANMEAANRALRDHHQWHPLLLRHIVCKQQLAWHSTISSPSTLSWPNLENRSCILATVQKPQRSYSSEKRSFSSKCSDCGKIAQQDGTMHFSWWIV